MSIVQFPTPQKPKTPPMFNVPPLTLYVITAFLVVHIIFLVLPPELQAIWGYNLAFVAARYTASDDFSLYAFTSPVTHMFLHGGWLHLCMNSMMMLAFGSGAERMLPRRAYIILFVVSGLGGAFAQFLLGWDSPIPMIGASGALSGLFAALAIRLQKSGMMPMGKFGIWGMAAMWIGLSFFMALVGGQVGIGNVAWAAHAGGFLTGMALMRMRYFL
jgi:membrane associated rhomboid family serine protease